MLIIAPQDATYKPDLVGHVRQQPYSHYTTVDRYSRVIDFYLSESKGAKTPLIIFIQGSGCGSLFGDAGGRSFPRLGHGTLVDIAGQRARILIVEKPGVKFQDPDVSVQQGASKTFLEEHTLDHWSEAVEAAAKAASKTTGVDGGNILVIGHSEGGLVAARVAKDLKAGHVALLAGGGASQLFDLRSYARKGYFFSDVSADPDAREKYVDDQWAEITKNPDSTTDFFFGHPYRRWSSFLSSSPIQELKGFKGEVFIGQGEDDKAVDPASGDALASALKAGGVIFVSEKVPGADHSFAVAKHPELDGWKGILSKVVDWFLSKAAP